MTRETKKAEKLLVISRGASAVNAEVEARLVGEFADYKIVEFRPSRDLRQLLAPKARVVVAGGDGTVEHVVRQLADADHPLGVLALGTFNNFARALGLPAELDKAIAVIKTGRARAITLGRVNGRVFLEACTIGLFGEAIVLGDSAKDLKFGEILEKLKNVISARRFEYEMSEDIQGKGAAMSLVFSNTSSIGSNLTVSSASPVDPYLELSIEAGRTRTDVVGRAIASALSKREDEGLGGQFRFRKLEVRTRPRVRIYADNRLVGRTPATISAETSALKVILPRGNP